MQKEIEDLKTMVKGGANSMGGGGIGGSSPSTKRSPDLLQM